MLFSVRAYYWFLFILGSLTLRSVCEVTVLIKPMSDASYPCSKPCFTLTEYIAIEYRNESNLNLKFLEGHHVLEFTDFTMTDLVGITLTADSDAIVIDCKGKTRFIFNNVSGLVIENITFISCGISSTSDSLPGVSLLNTDQVELTNVTIRNSSAGALFVQESTINITNILLENNRANINGTFSGLMARKSILYLQGSNAFVQNGIQEVITFSSLRCLQEAVFLVVDSMVISNGDLTVSNNTSPCTIMAFQNCSNVEINGASQFIGNTMSTFGALLFNNTDASMSGEILFSKNIGSYEIIHATAGICVKLSSLEITGKITFTDNSARISSIVANSSKITIKGSIQNNSNTYIGIDQSPNVVFVHNPSNLSCVNVFNSIITISGVLTFTDNGIVFISSHGNISLEGKTLFARNFGAIKLVESVLSVEGDHMFDENGQIGTIFASRSSLNFRGDGLYTNNWSTGDGGVLRASESNISIKGNATYVNNTASHYGGAIFGALTIFEIEKQTSLVFDSNSAVRGGSVFIVDIAKFVDCMEDSQSERRLCFIRFDLDDDISISFSFINNTARGGGSAMYGGRLDTCLFPYQSSNQSAFGILENVSEFKGYNTLPVVSSDPTNFCFCVNNTPNCGIPSVQKVVRRGETFVISMVAFSQTNLGGVRGTVRSFLQNPSRDSQQSFDGELQHLNDNCTDLYYRVYSESNEEELMVYADGLCRDLGNRARSVAVTFLDCPIGFARNVDKCVCDKQIRYFVDHCSVDNGTVVKVRESWIGVYKDENNSFAGLIVNRFCPTYYCAQPPVEIDVTVLSDQCIENRTGILCGGCKDNLSLALGSSKCMDCSNNAYLGLILLFAVLGILLIAALFLFQLTVSNGAIHGLIFYANIINAGLPVFIPTDGLIMLRVFIGWLNLDFGIDICFQDGMNQLAKTAWQFVFPFYLWLLVAIIIIACHFSIRISKIFAGRNPVSVLATIILLSYAKLLQNIIDIFSSSIIFLPNNSTYYVWWYDGNIELFTKNTPATWYVLLFFSVFILIVLYFPYTLTLLLAQHTQKSSLLSNCHDKLRLTPFIKDYQAPYKAPSRYWVGLCLLVRWIIMISEAFEETSATILVITTLCCCLLTIIGMSGGIYCNHLLDILELLFLLNLVLYSVTTYYVQINGGNQVAVAYVFNIFALILFAVIIVSQIMKQLKRYRFYQNIVSSVKKFKRTMSVQTVQTANTPIENDPVSMQEVFMNSNIYRDSILEDSIAL